MWGTLCAAFGQNAFGRFIPTHVGNTPRSPPAPAPATVHPHACGEHPRQVLRRLIGLGSSPRMWGTLERAEDRQPDVRFIPTHVGNTVKGFYSSSSISVHPHACGEHDGNTLFPNITIGSSPRMWGTPERVRLGDLLNRFIPTHVGNTINVTYIQFVSPVHPHACGEHVLYFPSSYSFVGSSPRMWGTPHHRNVCQYIHRFIPTHVGNTLFILHVNNSLSVHPHACGEHPPHLLSDPECFGSSPRMWGTRLRETPLFWGCRFIPTHVGNT